MLAGERVIESLQWYLLYAFEVKVNERNGAGDRPWRSVFLGYTVIWHRRPQLKRACSSVEILKGKLKDAFLWVGDAM
jgi:RNA-directed DNA polymerase